MEVLVFIGGVAFIYFVFMKDKKGSGKSENYSNSKPGNYSQPKSQPVSSASSAGARNITTAKAQTPHSNSQSGQAKRAAPASKSHEPFEFCALDTETTGIVPKSPRHRAFEISVVKFSPSSNGNWKKTKFTRYIDVDTSSMKGLKLSPMWMEHSKKIGQLEVTDAKRALIDLKEFVGSAPIVCHNAKFDKCVIENEIEKTATGWRPGNRWICTLEMARAGGFGKHVGFSPGRDDGKSYRLMDVAGALQLRVEDEKLHFGYYDAELAGNILLKLHHIEYQALRYIR